LLASLVMKTVKVSIGRAEYDDLVPEDALSRHKVRRDGSVVAYLHSFEGEQKIEYRLYDLDMRPLGGRFLGKDDVREWVRYDLR
jgi:hypothetical protein